MLLSESLAQLFIAVFTTLFCTGFVELVDKEGAGEFIDMINDDENYSAIYKNCNFTYI